MFHNLLTDKIIRATKTNGKQVILSLPGVYEALRKNDIVSFPALRPHQRHAWHAFLCQLGTMAIEISGDNEPPEKEEAWQQYLRKLTKDYKDDEPWCLVVEDNKKPAFMQPPEAPVKNIIHSPDELDSNIVTAKNHDIKQSVARNSMLDDWLFALISLQTMIGFSGNGNYGIARMNGGSSSRCCFGLQSANEELGKRVFQDIAGMLTQIDKLSSTFKYKKDGVRLLWMKAWSKDESLSTRELHPYFIEISRRLRLEKFGDNVRGKRGISKKPRVNAKNWSGVTGDFWALTSADGTKSLTVTKESFGYRKLSEYLFDPGKWRLPESILSCKSEKNMQIIVSGMVGGQGKTEGYFERKIPFAAKEAKKMFIGGSREACGKLAEEQVNEINTVISTMRGAIQRLQKTNGSVSHSQKKNSDAQAIYYYSKQLASKADYYFFPVLFERIGNDDEGERRQIQEKLLKKLFSFAEKLVKEAAKGLPQKGITHLRNFNDAMGYFYGRRKKKLDEYIANAAS